MKKFLYIKLSFIFLFLVACTNIEGNQFKADSLKAKHAIIFVPGFYGSALQNTQNQSLTWLNLGNILFNNTSLAMHGSKLGIKNSYQLDSVAILKSLSIIPPLFVKDIYAENLESLESKILSREHYLVPFPYDWRDSVDVAASKLKKLIHQTKQLGANKISIIAHSFGGLVAAYYIRFGGQKIDHAKETWEGLSQVDKVIIAGAPFKGSMHIFRNMQLGRAVLYNNSLLSPEAFSSFPASYQLLPYKKKNFINAKSEDITLSIFDAQAWNKNAWGLFQKNTKSPIYENRLNFKKEQLAKAKRFFDLLHKIAPKTQAISKKILLLNSDTQLMIDKALWLKSHRQLVFPDDDFKTYKDRFQFHVNIKDLSTRGDGSVSLTSSLLPKAYESHIANIKTVSCDHQYFFTNKDIIKVSRQFIK